MKIRPKVPVCTDCDHVFEYRGRNPGQLGGVVVQFGEAYCTKKKKPRLLKRWHNMLRVPEWCKKRIQPSLVRIEADEEGVAKALWVQPQIIGEVDKAGRPRPGNANLPEVRLEADIIVVAIGQGIEISGFDAAGVPIKRGTFVAGLSGQVGDMDNVFAGGDCVTGPATAIRAIAAGKVAAANIDEHLGFRHEIRVDVDIPAPRLNNRPPHGRINTTERQACERKCDFEDIECGLTEEGAVTEASRCLRCDHFGYGIFRGGRDIKW